MKSKFFKIKNKFVGDRKQVFIIAEIGINHDGNLKKCLKMIKEAAKAGANSVKIQTNEVEESYMQNTVSYKAFKNKNFSNEELLKLKKYSEKLGIIFFFNTWRYKKFEQIS